MSGHNHSFSGAALGDHGHTFFGVAMGGHVHTITTNSLNGGVTQQSVNITPQSLSVNTFIYLGQ
jgi:hypothetical protein